MAKRKPTLRSSIGARLRHQAMNEMLVNLSRRGGSHVLDSKKRAKRKLFREIEEGLRELKNSTD